METDGKFFKKKQLCKMRFYGIIPARGGSLGIPRKNICLLRGKPLIAYSIEAARESSFLDRTIISSDDEEIAQIAQDYGVEVPFLRPKSLAKSDSRSVDVVIHALDWFKVNNGFEPDYVVLLQPTSPLRTAQHIDEAIQLCLKNNADSVVSTCLAKHHPYRMKVIEADGALRPFMDVDSYKFHRRQDLPLVYSTNGAIYLVRSSVLRERNSFFAERTYAYMMDSMDSIDIDSEWDLQVAEFVLQKKMGDIG